MNRISKILIANRGEIALRIQKAAHSLGKKTVSVCSEADTNALYVRHADELQVIGAAPAAESYLHIENIITAAKETGCDAVHPGYGFLSENAEFAQAVIDAGLIFIGPSPECIRILGSKTEARAIATKIALPLPPGTAGGLSDEQLIAEADRIGYPLMIKAAGGGGGRGMRAVSNVKELQESLRLARSEAKKFFRDDNVFLEKRILEPRHVDVQVFGDQHGNVVHFGTRDCSTQRRHQKLVEEAPAPGLNPQLLESIHSAAVKLAREVHYHNAGTVEFLVSGDQFYFLEMNTRIQVEHPVSEEISGVDLVALQIKVAEGEELPFAQDEVRLSGHSIEFRIYAEDPKRDFQPSLGTIKRISVPGNDSVRIDTGYEAGDVVTPFYDAMLSKVIVTAENRSGAIERSKEFFSQFAIEGIGTNTPFHRWLLHDTPFAEKPVSISFLEENFNRETISDFEISQLRDPYHRESLGLSSYVEHFRYFDEQSGKSCLVELVHLPDGTFLAAPVDDEGRYALEKYCRRSNGHQTAVSSLSEEVLTKVPIGELFG